MAGARLGRWETTVCRDNKVLHMERQRLLGRLLAAASCGAPLARAALLSLQGTSRAYDAWVQAEGMHDLFASVHTADCCLKVPWGHPLRHMTVSQHCTKFTERVC